jgi:hypothetical protein
LDGELSKDDPVVTFCVYGFHIGCQTALRSATRASMRRTWRAGHYAGRQEGSDEIAGVDWHPGRSHIGSGPELPLVAVDFSPIDLGDYYVDAIEVDDKAIGIIGSRDVLQSLPANRTRTEMFVVLYANGAPEEIRTPDP